MLRVPASSLGSHLWRSATARAVAPMAAAAVPSVMSSPLAAAGAARFINLQEYQAKDLMEEYGVVVQKGSHAETAAEARKVAEAIKADNADAELILKAQILAGGRGKGVFNTGFKGGVKICTKPDEVEEFAGEMLGNYLVTKQTGPEGQQVRHLLVNEGITIESEYYFAILMDRAHDGPVIVASTEGGMDIEEVAEKTPEAILKVPVSIVTGLTDDAAEQLARDLKFEEALVPAAAKQFQALYNMFIGRDATQVEINPLAVGFVPGFEKRVFAVDAKLNFDDSAEFRQKELFAMRDISLEDPREVEAGKYDLNYIGLDGNIGCMVNGAGLAMATMDVIKLHGGNPANFLDVGGGVTADRVARAFEIVTSSDEVDGLFINIFGGIVRCDVIAEGIIEAAKQVDLKVPIVARLRGTNAELGMEMLKTSGINITTADDLDEAAKLAVAAAS